MHDLPHTTVLLFKEFGLTSRRSHIMSSGILAWCIFAWWPRNPTKLSVCVWKWGRAPRVDTSMTTAGGVQDEGHEARWDLSFKLWAPCFCTLFSLIQVGLKVWAPSGLSGSRWGVHGAWTKAYDSTAQAGENESNTDLESPKPCSSGMYLPWYRDPQIELRYIPWLKGFRLPEQLTTAIEVRLFGAPSRAYVLKVGYK